MDAAPPESENKNKAQPRKFEVPVLMIWALVTLNASIYFSNFLVLAYLYGFARVRSEHLHFTATPKGRDWIVSNGDHVREAGSFLHFVISLFLWLALFLATFRIIRWFLPERKGPAPVH